MSRDEVWEESSLPPRRAILLGASNIVRSFSTVVGTCHKICGAPWDIVAAIGHGRGYGLESWVLGRTLPPILQCGLWRALALRPAAETVALVTDIGNDLVYDATAEQVATWIEQCIERLRPRAGRIILTTLPLTSIARLRPASFLLLRTLLFPRSRITLRVALERARRLEERLIQLAAKHAADLIQPDEQWYGWDPIHIKFSCRRQAWQTILAPRGEPRQTELATVSLSRWWSLCCLRPEHRRLFGIAQSRSQPCAKLADGSLISLY